MNRKDSLASLFVELNQLPMALNGIVHVQLHNGISLSKFEPTTKNLVNGTRLSTVENEQRNAAPVSRLRIGPALFARPLCYPQP